MTTIFVSGDRDWTDLELVYRQLREFPAGTRLIHGAALGADSIAANVGKELGFDIEDFPANWSKYGRAAGPMRNRDMMKRLLEIGANNCRCFLFHDDIENSKGTKDMKSLLDKHNFTYSLITHSLI